MEVETTRFGKIQVEEAAVIRFEAGLIGFRNHREFVLVPHGSSSVIAWLQSLVAPDLAFPVLSAHGIAVAWITYDRFGARTEYQPSSPLDPVFYLRRPGGHAAHLWRLFKTKREAVQYMAEYFGRDPESGDWAERLKAEDFQELVDRYGKKP